MSQTQIGENPDNPVDTNRKLDVLCTFNLRPVSTGNFNKVKSYTLASNYRQLTKLVMTDASQRIWQKRLNITYYKQNINFTAFIKSTRVNSKHRLLISNTGWPYTELIVNTDDDPCLDVKISYHSTLSSKT